MLKTIAIALFVLMYALMIFLPAKRRPYIACGTAAIFLALGILPIGDLFHTIDSGV